MSQSVLVVEDNPDVLHVLMWALTEEAGYTAHSAPDLETARVLMSKLGQDLDLVLLDMQLPDGNGISFCASIRRQGNNLPIIILSRHASEDDVERAFVAGASDYLIKPIYSSVLLAHVSLQLRHGSVNRDRRVVSHDSHILRPCSNGQRPYQQFTRAC